MLSIGGPLWGVAIALMLMTLLVLNLARLRRRGSVPSLLPVVVTVVVVLGVCGLVLAFGRP